VLTQLQNMLKKEMRYLSMHQTGIFVGEFFEKLVFFYRRSAISKSSPGRISTGYYFRDREMPCSEEILPLDWTATSWTGHCPAFLI